ncbi:acyltransferase family protein [Anopheles sinensis]|uniref:Acyltransferase family protein n=1 Tax=Anopheles sinensis TaxID=74873 RepID=A0A084VGS6_ANOSI|nr:acyltransferase family protein [Anopheles sinensis]
MGHSHACHPASCDKHHWSVLIPLGSPPNTASAAFRLPPPSHVRRRRKSFSEPASPRHVDGLGAHDLCAVPLLAPVRFDLSRSGRFRSLRVVFYFAVTNRSAPFSIVELVPGKGLIDGHDDGIGSSSALGIRCSAVRITSTVTH